VAWVIVKGADMTTMWRLPQALAESGKTRSPWYQDIAHGTMTKPVKIGPRAAGWPAHEVRAVIAARIAGADIKQLRELVEHLHTARKGVQ
jgi:prophage regulatory protein